jgi:uncharacterized lipoprotein YmbA
MQSRHLSPVFLLACLALLASCGSTDPSRFYVLSRAETTSDLMQLEGGPQVRLGPIELPDYLSRPEIVSRRGQHRVVLAEYDRWATDLEELFAQTLQANLIIMLPSEHVVRFAWEPLVSADHFITVSVGRFEVMDGTAVLTARWGMADDIGEATAMHLSQYTEPVQGDDYVAIVAALSKTLAALSREIADAVNGD